MRKLERKRDAKPATSESGEASVSTVAQGQTRLALFATLVACASSFSLAFEAALAYGPGWVDAASLRRTALARGGVVALSVLVLGVTRLRALSASAVSWIGLTYQLAGALLVALAELRADHFGADHAQPSWLCLWIVLFPFVVPASPARCLAAALATALFPASLLLATAAPGPAALAAALVPHLVCGVLPAYALDRLATSLRAARREARDLGSYQLTSKIGQGGMGAVWRAEHRLLARPAAIKVVKPDVLAALSEGQRREWLERFQREARAIAQLRSPHTVSLFDYGLTEDGTVYYAMELLDGVDLEALVVRHGPLGPARAVFILEQLCASLGEAHEAGLVHRDVKPANVFLARLGLEHDFVKVLDFGLVKRTPRASRGSQARITSEHVVVGTPTCISPEAVIGAEVDARADVYAVGCVAYWLLTGTHVFEVRGRNSIQVVLDHANTKPQRPSMRLGRALPADLEALVMACLEKEPALRPRDGQSLARRLRDCLRERPWTRDDARRWWAAHLPAMAAPRAPASSSDERPTELAPSARAVA